MLFRAHLFAGIAGLAMLLVPLVAAAQPEPPIGKIIWADVDFPPFQIVQGKHRGSGSFDGLRDLLIQEMTGIEHEVVTMTFMQREEALRFGRPICSAGMFRTPARERYLVFSRPALIHLDNRLVFLNRTADRFPSTPIVNLAQVLGDKSLKGGIIVGRSFAPSVDALLRRYGGAPNVKFLVKTPAEVFALLGQGEIDYTILFSNEADYLKEESQFDGDVITRSIAGVPPYILTDVACTRSEWGERVITRVNRIVSSQRNSPAYRQLSERWYSPDDRALIRYYYPKLSEAGKDQPR